MNMNTSSDISMCEHLRSTRSAVALALTSYRRVPATSYVAHQIMSDLYSYDKCVYQMLRIIDENRRIRT